MKLTQSILSGGKTLELFRLMGRKLRKVATVTVNAAGGLTLNLRRCYRTESTGFRKGFQYGRRDYATGELLLWWNMVGEIPSGFSRRTHGQVRIKRAPAKTQKRQVSGTIFRIIRECHQERQRIAAVMALDRQIVRAAYQAGGFFGVGGGTGKDRGGNDIRHTDDRKGAPVDGSGGGLDHAEHERRDGRMKCEMNQTKSKTAQFTPGPWKLGKTFWSAGRGLTVLETEDGKNVIAHLGIPLPNPNARLIAQSPAMYEQLKALTVQLEACGMVVPPGVRNVLAQVEGR